jgi:O-antigen ligase
MGLVSAGMATLIVPKQHRLRVVLAASILGGLALSLTGRSLVAFKRDKHVPAKYTAESMKLRPVLAAYAYEMFQDYPLTGVGLSQYKRHNFEYVTKRSFDVPMGEVTQYVQHNIFLSLLIETGLLGLGLLIIVLGLWAYDGWTLWYTTDLPLWRRQFGLLMILLIAAYIANGMFHELSLIPMLNMLVFFVAGLCRNAQDELAATGHVATTAKQSANAGYGSFASTPHVGYRTRS